ncbi:hypothetical protein Rs2_29552 [Raphanus sativus]|nr:hypothetical protein Rs2_29552 [Raphanus sativus]
MTQGQLLGCSEVTKTGEGMRKCLKISVPHFDNSALIKTFSKTLIGRCMNPEAQDMKALLGNLPKIWKVEDRVLGTDLGFGKFQFDFEREEDIETILNLQPFHFDYWMLAIGHEKNKAKAQVNTGEASNGGWQDVGKHDDRARSYKGVLIHGNGNHQGKERDGRDYYGKGKGKVGGGAETKWMQKGEQSNKRGYGNRGYARGEAETSRYRSKSKGATHQSGYKGTSSGEIQRTEETRVNGGDGQNSREEGEIVITEEQGTGEASKEFQAELLKTQAEGSEVVSDLVTVLEGTQLVQNLEEKQAGLSENEIMEWDEIRATLMEKGIDLDAPEDSKEMAEGELEDFNMDMVESEMRAFSPGNDLTEVDKEQEITAVDAEPAVKEAGKKQGTRKKVFKGMISTAGSSKMRLASALASPRKRGISKVPARHGDNVKQEESKEASIPKPDQSKK